MVLLTIPGVREACNQMGRRSASQHTGWSWRCLSATGPNGQTIWIVDAHRADGNRFVVQADNKLTAFVELEWAIRRASTV